MNFFVDYKYAIFWLVLVIVFGVIEGVTPQLASIWFAGGALAALIVSLFRVDVWIQAVVFVGVSALLLALTRPLVKKRLRAAVVPTNSDAAIGKVAVVTERIDNTGATGFVRLDGTLWTARSADGSPVEEGEEVIVDRIEGVKLIVSRKTENESAADAE